jgi:hypothetical protein
MSVPASGRRFKGGEKPGGGKTDVAWQVFERGYASKLEADWLHRDGDTR